MARNRGGLLAQIAGDVADRSVPLSSLLQNCILLGGQAGSERMRTWASQEMHGYAGVETVPEYRHVTVALTARITNMAGRNGITQQFDDSVFDSRVREMIREKVDVQDAIIPFGIGRLEAMASEDTDEQCLVPEWAGFIADVLNQYHMGPNSRVANVYWSVPRSAIQGVLVRIRTALAELVAELIALTPEDQEVPDKQAADQVMQFVITGDRSVINYIVQHAAGDGAVTAVAGGAGAGPVAVSSGDGTAIGSQTASGANSSVVGSQTASGANSSVVGGQSARAGRDVVTAGQDAAVPPAGEQQPVKEGWWARLRKRGAVVAFATIIGALAGVAGVVIAIMVAAGWKP
jgi:AbiTii